MWHRDRAVVAGATNPVIPMTRENTDDSWWDPATVGWAAPLLLALPSMAHSATNSAAPAVVSSEHEPEADSYPCPCSPPAASWGSGGTDGRVDGGRLGRLGRGGLDVAATVADDSEDAGVSDDDPCSSSNSAEASPSASVSAWPAWPAPAEQSWSHGSWETWGVVNAAMPVVGVMGVMGHGPWQPWGHGPWAM